MSDTGVLISLDEAKAEDSQVILDYTNRDFTSIRAQLIGLAKGLMPEWETVGEPADFGTLILELFAYMGDVLHFYIDRTASEAFLGTAVRRNSVLYIADMMGYHPIGQSSAVVTMVFTLDEDAVAAEIAGVTIPKGTRIHNATNNTSNLVAFELQEDVILNRTDPDPDPGDPDGEKPWKQSVLAMEGLTIRDYKLGIAAGVPNTEFQIPEKGVVYRSMSIVTREGYVNIQWDFISDLSLARPTQAAFTTYTDEVGFTYVVFGDNAAGRIPTVNAEVFATYRIGVGAVANDLESGSISVIIPPETIDGIEFVSAVNEGSPIGGADPESIDSMKYSIPRSAARMKNRAVTLNDYADLALQVPGVAKSVSYGTTYTTVYVRIALAAPGDAPSETMEAKCREVEAYMQDKVLIGSTVIVEPYDSDKLFNSETEQGEIYIRVLIHVAETYNRTSVREQVDAVIRKLLNYDTVDFGTWIAVGNVYRASLAVQGVERVDLKWLSTVEPPEDIPDIGEGISGITALFSAQWRYDALTSGDPGTGDYRMNDPVATTLLIFSETDVTVYNQSPKLMGLQIGDQIMMRPMDDISSWRVFIVTAAPPVDSGAYIQVTVAKVNEAGTVDPPDPTDEVLFDFYRPNPTPQSLVEVHDIQTPELLIPRIKKMDTDSGMIVEDLTDFPNMTEAERTHDGLWVWATGGVTGT